MCGVNRISAQAAAVQLAFPKFTGQSLVGLCPLIRVFLVFAIVSGHSLLLKVEVSKPIHEVTSLATRARPLNLKYLYPLCIDVFLLA